MKLSIFYERKHFFGGREVANDSAVIENKEDAKKYINKGIKKINTDIGTSSLTVENLTFYKEHRHAGTDLYEVVERSGNNSKDIYDISIKELKNKINDLIKKEFN